MKHMFNSATSFNQDIGDWDVSKVAAGEMTRMFYKATTFNQDLTKWCVSNQNQEPSYFSYSSALTDQNKPVWGTCPSN